jgi:hypothetical protein
MASEKDTQREGSGNFANDPGRAREAGKKGGEQSHQSGGGTQRQSDGSGSGSGISPTIEDVPARRGSKGGESSRGSSQSGSHK